MSYESFFEALNYHLGRKGYGGQALLCRHTGIPRSYLSRIMGQNRRAGARTQRKIARFFGYGLEEFIEFGRRLTMGEDPERSPDMLQQLPEEHLVQRLTEAVRKEMQTARLLNQTQLLYESIVENSRQLIVRFADNMTMTFINRAGEQMAGQDRAELLGRDWKELVGAEYRDAFALEVGKVRAQGGSFAMESPGADGMRWLYLTVTVFPEGSGGTDRGQVVGFDITEEVVTRNKLEKSERDLNLIYNGSPDMMASVDAASGMIVQCNRTMGRKLQYPPARIVKGSLFDFCDEAGARDARRIFREFLAKKEIRDQELVLRKKNGKPLPVLLNMTAIQDEHGRISANCVFRDQTERRRLIDRLRFIQHGVEMSYVPTLWIGHDAGIVYANRAVSNLLGYTRKELSRMHVWDINPLIPRAEWPEKWAWFRAEESVVFAGQYLTKEQRIIPVEFQVSNLEYPDGRRYNVVFVKSMEGGNTDIPCESR